MFSIICAALLYLWLTVKTISKFSLVVDFLRFNREGKVLEKLNDNSGKFSSFVGTVQGCKMYREFALYKTFDCFNMCIEPPKDFLQLLVSIAPPRSMPFHKSIRKYGSTSDLKENKQPSYVVA